MIQDLFDFGPFFRGNSEEKRDNLEQFLRVKRGNGFDLSFLHFFEKGFHVVGPKRQLKGGHFVKQTS